MPSNYQPGIPTGTVPLNQDYLNIKNNFTQLNTTFGTDHTTVSDTSAENGYHKSVHLVPQSPPIALAGYGQLYSQTVNDLYNTDQELKWKTGNGLDIQLTSNFLPILAAASGTTFLPGGLVIQWGFQSTLSNITFPIPFKTECYGIWFTYQKATALPTSAAITVVVVSLSTTACGISPNVTGVSTSQIGMYWIAIGK